jgi:hypothetical protein
MSTRGAVGSEKQTDHLVINYRISVMGELRKETFKLWFCEKLEQFYLADTMLSKLTT